MGALGRDSAFVLAPDGEDLHLPSDLAGITVAHYDALRDDKNWPAATGPACNRILQAFGQSAPNRRAPALTETDDPTFTAALEWVLAQLSAPERQALIQMIRDGVLEYTEATKNKYKQLRNLGLARTTTNRSLKNDNQLVPTPMGEYIVRVLATRSK